MNTRQSRLAASATALLLLAGCSDATQRATYPPSSTPLSQPANLDPTPPAAPDETVIAAPAPSVESTDLAPPSLEPGTEVAAVEPQTAPVTSAQPISREAMIGAWTVATGGKNCQIFLALTKWSGGYRAATRGCAGSDVAGVQAWDVKSNKIVLVDASGGQAASLSKTGDTKYSGATQGGGSISFSR